MRPPAIERMGYYPTDEPVVEIIRTYLKPPSERGRLFDPCAGEGKAASSLGNALNCETWGAWGRSGRYQDGRTLERREPSRPSTPTSRAARDSP